jgi:hypothetical protein
LIGAREPIIVLKDGSYIEITEEVIISGLHLRKGKDIMSLVPQLTIARAAPPSHSKAEEQDQPRESVKEAQKVL